MQDEYIPLEKLTEGQNRVIETLIETFYKLDMLEAVSEKRTGAIIDIAQKLGFGAVESEKLASHFNAATKMIASMDPEAKKEFNETLKKRFSPKP